MNRIRACRLAWTLAVALLMGACLDRPVGKLSPNTTNVIVERLVRTGVRKIDMLFVVDNSVSMGDKQTLLAAALPDLVKRLVSPVCLTPDGVVVSAPETSGTPCPAGASREFEPVNDIHVGVITSSLGGFGADETCVPTAQAFSDENVDMSHLIPTLARWDGDALANGFLSWSATTGSTAFVDTFKQMVTRAGEHGCGLEAPLEAWYRFLVDPAPYAALVKSPCSDDPAAPDCVGPETLGDGSVRVDQQLLDQRAAFLRPDSLLAVVMLSDENDCSFRASGQSWLLATTTRNGETSYAPRASRACETDPNSACCRPCTSSTLPDGCATGTNSKTGATVLQGCEESRYYTPGDATEVGDHANLRCFDQKRRFGVDVLYPEERYVNALTADTLCPSAANLSADGCEAPVENPLLYPRDANGSPLPPRNADLVYLAGIVGVPWQDVAVSPDPAERLSYLPSTPAEPGDPSINWDWLLGDSANTRDPLMREQVEPRAGTSPSTGEALAAPDAPLLANSINGHERALTTGDLQYACIFPLPSAVECPNEATPGCDCSGDDAAQKMNPLCQQQDGSYARLQRYGKAYPGLRQLRVLRKVGQNAIVASICPKQTDEQDADDFGYRPVVETLIDRLKGGLAEKCISRPLAVDGDGIASCLVVEVQPSGLEPCEAQATRFAVPEKTEREIRKRLELWQECEGAECDAVQMCGIVRLDQTQAAEAESCQNDATALGDGWCYIDPANGVGSSALVEDCAATAQRKIRFIGTGNPADARPTVIACAGATQEHGAVLRPMAE